MNKINSLCEELNDKPESRGGIYITCENQLECTYFIIGLLYIFCNESSTPLDIKKAKVSIEMLKKSISRDRAKKNANLKYDILPSEMSYKFKLSEYLHITYSTIAELFGLKSRDGKTKLQFVFSRYIILTGKSVYNRCEKSESFKKQTENMLFSELLNKIFKNCVCKG